MSSWATAKVTNSDHQREQARARQTRKRTRDRADRIEQQAEDEAAKLPRAWRSDFLDFVRNARERADKSLLEVEKSALLLPAGSARDAYVKANYRNTKVSVTRLSKEFVRRKTNLAWAELYQDPEDSDLSDRLGVEDVDWEDLQEVACVLGDPSDQELVVVQPMARFVVGVVLASASVGNTLIGFAQATELFRFLEEMRLRQLDALAA